MTRYVPEVADGTLRLVAKSGGDELEIGAVEDVVTAMGDDSHRIEYDQQQRSQPWLDTDDGVIEVDVRETATTLPHTEETVARLRNYDMGTERYGLPRRTVEFANELVDILEQQGTQGSGIPE